MMTHIRTIHSHDHLLYHEYCNIDVTQQTFFFIFIMSSQTSQQRYCDIAYISHRLLLAISNQIIDFLILARAMKCTSEVQFQFPARMSRMSLSGLDLIFFSAHTFALVSLSLLSSCNTLLAGENYAKKKLTNIFFYVNVSNLCQC